MKRIRRAVIGLLVTLIFTLLLVEGMLRFVDPIGLYTYFEDIYWLGQQGQPHPTGYRYQAGTHELNRFTVTVNEDGNRIIPATNHDADCTVVLLGDSYTFGWGADDADVWGNLLAQALPDVQIINMAKLGYNTSNIRTTLDFAAEHHTPDAYIWFIISNDADAPYLFTRPTGEAFPAATELHVRHLLLPALRGDAADPDPTLPDWFWQDVDYLLSRDNLFAFGVTPDNNTLTQQVADRYPQVQLIPTYTREHHVSAYDTHLNAAGNAYIMAIVGDALQAFVEMHCGNYSTE